MTKLTGRGVSPGTAIGRAVIAVRDARHVRYRLASSGVDRERQRLRAARERTRVELEEISSRVSRTVGTAQAAIFAAQLLMLDDPLLTKRADELIRSERINGDWALERAIAELHDVFAREGDDWLRERVGDLADVGGRLQRNLRPGRDPLVDLVHELEPPLVIVADELSPSLAAQLDWTRVRGLVCDLGSPTHHTVILARSLGVPTVVGLSGATQLIGPGQTIALDGTTGEVVLEPSEDAIERWRRRAEIAAAALRRLDELRSRPAVTADGTRIRLEAQPRNRRRCRPRARRRGRGHRPLSIGIPHRRRAARDRVRTGADRHVPRAARSDAAPAGDDPHVRRRRRSVGQPLARRPSRALRRSGRARRAPARRAVPGADSRAPPRRAGRRAPHPAAVRDDGRRAAAGARAHRRDRRRRGLERRRAHRRDDRGARRRDHRRSSGRARRLSQRRHERSHSVHARDRSHRRAARGALRAARACRAPPVARGLGGRTPREVRSVGVRRNGGRPAPRRPAGGPGVPDVQHDAGRDPASSSAGWPRWTAVRQPRSRWRRCAPARSTRSTPCSRRLPTRCTARPWKDP